MIRSQGRSDRGKRAASRAPSCWPLTVAGALLAGCTSTGSGEAVKDTVQTLAEAQQQVDRTFREPFDNKPPARLAEGQAVLGPAARAIDMSQLKPAIERFARSRNQVAGSYVAAGAQLTPDGKIRALVLFTSPNWCQPQGCDLVIFEQGSFDWRPAATISRVKAPVLVSPSVTAGWHDLWAATGREAQGKDKKSFLTNVHLKYGSSGYPATTTFAIAGTQGAPQGEAVFQTAEMQLPSKTRFATGGRSGDHGKKKLKEMTPAVVPGLAPAPAKKAVTPP